MRLKDAASSSFDCFNIDLKERHDDTVSSIDLQRTYAALELSKNSWVLAIQVPGRDNPSLYPIRGGNAEGLMAKLDAARDRVAQVHHRTQAQKGRIRRVMIVALAGKLAIAFWRYLETGLIPEGAVVK